MTINIKYIILFVGGALLGMVLYVGHTQGMRFITGATNKVDRNTLAVIDPTLEIKYKKIVFAGGCFWSMEGEFNHLPGVVAAISGYAGGSTVNPSYEDVGSGQTGHKEAVAVYYDEASTTIDTLLTVYWKHIDPTDGEGQFVDQGSQYRTAIYYTNDVQKTESLKTKQMLIDAKKFTKPIVTEILSYVNFYPAEEYHQDYEDKNPVSYGLYRKGSGRDEFFKKYWGNDTTTFSKLVTNNISMNTNDNTNQNTNATTSRKVLHPWQSFKKPSDAQLHSMLTPIEYNVTQKDGTEAPFDNAYAEKKDIGIYVDIVSGEPLFLSVDKYDSGTGWPSFVKPVATSAVVLKEDDQLLAPRTEVRSTIADSHLGHVFPDGPKDRGGLRYCMNSASLRFIPLADMEKEGYGDYIAQLK